MASFSRAKVDSATQTDPPLPFTALLDRALDRVEATVPLNLSSITFHIRRHHLSRIEQLEALLSENLFFRLVLFRIGLKPQHVFSFLCLLTLYGCRQLYRKSVYLTTNLCAVAYPAYCSIKTINSEPIAPPRELGLEPTVYGPPYGRHSHSTSNLSIASSRHQGLGSSRRARKQALARGMTEDSMQSSNSYSSSSSQEEYRSRRSLASSWGRPSDYSNYSEDNLTSTTGSIAPLTVEEKMKIRMRRRWALFSHSRKEKATRQWLAYWSIYGTVQVVDTWSSFLLDWIPGYNLGKLLFLWWAQRRGATLVFDYFQPLIQTKSKDGREVARKASNRSLNSEMSRSGHGRGGSSGGGGGGPGGILGFGQGQMPSTLAQQQQQLHQQYQQEQPHYKQRQFEQQFYAKGSSSRRDTATFHELSRRQETLDDSEDFDQELDHRHRELMTSSPHGSGSFADTSLFESAESVWSAPQTSTSVQATEEIPMGGTALGLSGSRLHSNNATPTPMSVQEQYQRRLLVQQDQKQSGLHLQQSSSAKTNALHPYAVASTIHWNPPLPANSSTSDAYPQHA